MEEPKIEGINALSCLATPAAALAVGSNLTYIMSLSAICSAPAVITIAGIG